jgi:Protein of unknown function (DUF1194)
MLASLAGAWFNRPVILFQEVAMRVRANLAVGLLAMWMFAVGAGAGTAVAQQPVDLELVLAIDISGSVDEEEAALQREGYVLALNNPRVIAAMGGGPFGAIAVTYVEWAGEDYQRTVVPWTLIGNAEQAARFAEQIQASPFASARWTSLSGAIDYSATLFAGNGFDGVRQVIDISGDGVNNRGRPPVLARDQAVAAGITINGLPILNDRPNPWGGAAPIDLDRYYEENVIGGPGAFYIAARDFDDFSAAILSKLIREIAGLRDGAG